MVNCSRRSSVHCYVFLRTSRLGVVWEELKAKLYLLYLRSLILTVILPPWRSLRTDLYMVITWGGLELCMVELMAYRFLFTCQSDIEIQHV